MMAVGAGLHGGMAFVIAPELTMPARSVISRTSPWPA